MVCLPELFIAVAAGRAGCCATGAHDDCGIPEAATGGTIYRCGCFVSVSVALFPGEHNEERGRDDVSGRDRDSDQLDHE